MTSAASGLIDTGVVLFVARYEPCVAFYRDVLGLPVASSQPTLTCFRFGGAYLMVEAGGVGDGAPKDRSRNPTVLRFDVADLEQRVAALRARGVAVDVHAFDWGTIGQLRDPDGNLCELKAAP